MLQQVFNSLNDIAADAENQNAASIKKNMGILADSIKDIIAIDGVGMIDLNEKIGHTRG